MYCKSWNYYYLLIIYYCIFFITGISAAAAAGASSSNLKSTDHQQNNQNDELPDRDESEPERDTTEINQGAVSSCLLKCKDDHMVKMDNEWSMDFAFPLLSLLRTNGSIEAAKEKARKICEDNDMLDMCLRGCHYSLEQKILRLGLEPWNQLCLRFEVLIGEFQCWRNNIDTLTLGCYLESHNLRQSMETLTHNLSLLVVDAICRDMNTLSTCSIDEYTKFCGHVTRMLLVRLFQSSRKSIIGMLKVKWPVLPDECSQLVQFYEEEEQLALSHAFPTSSNLNIALFYLAILYFFISIN